MTLPKQKKSNNSLPTDNNQAVPAIAPGKWWWKSYAVGSLLLTIVVGLVFWQILAVQYKIGSASDFPTHAERAQSLADGTPKDMTHPLYQWLIIVVAKLTHTDFQTAGLLAALLLYVLIGCLLYARIMWPIQGGVSAASTSNQGVSWLLGAIAVLSLMLCNPITSFTHFHLYFGYVNVNVFHNPTMLALKPFALLAFWQAISLIEIRKIGVSSFLIRLALVIATIACSSLAKPSFVMIFLPSLGMFAAYLTLRMRLESKHAWIVFIACSVAGVTTLLFQLMRYTSYEYGNSFAFAPFKTSSDSGGWIVFKLLMSIAFPLSVVIMFRRAATTHWRLPLAWLVFIVSWLIANLFVEDGPSLLFRNFTWCGQIGIFILFVESMAFLREQSFMARPLSLEREGYLKSAAVCFIVLACHVTAGLSFYMLYVAGINVELLY